MGTWIEISLCDRISAGEVWVVPYVGTWIEICCARYNHTYQQVVPYVGTWIEILKLSISPAVFGVVPYVGTWIEIWHCTHITDI